MGYVSKYRGVDIDQAIEFAKEHADINEKLSEKAEVLHSHKLSDITGLADLKVSWENITGKPETFPCDGSCGGTGSGGDNSEGSGNGSGGQVSGTISWGNITGKPSTFTPSAHTHVITDLSNVGDLKIDWNNIINKPENITGGGSTTPTQITWEIIQNKPTVFTPATHRHHVSEIDGLSTGTGGSSNGTVTWDNVLEKPDLASKIHKHSISDVIGLEDRLTYIEENAGSGSGGNNSGSGSSSEDVTELKTKVEIIQNDVDNLQSQVEIVQGGYNIVQGSVMSLQSTIGSIQSSNLDLKEDVLENKTDITNLKSSVDSLEQKLGQENNYATEIAGLKQNVSSLQAKDNELYTNIVDAKGQISVLREDLDNQGKTISEIESNASNALKIAEDVQKTVEELEDGLEDQLDDILSGSDFGTRLDNVEANVENNTSSIEEINTSITEVQDEILELSGSIDSINDNLGEHYYIWQGEDDSIPDLTNEPAVQWATTSDKRLHVGDFYINTEGYCFKFVEENNRFSWVEVKDRYIVPYARQIAEKSRIFIAQPSVDDSYKSGDLWINATYIENGNELYKSETLVCIEEKLEGDEFDINHWESTNYASTQDIIDVTNSLIKYQRRVVLQKKEDLFKEETWLENGEPWIYNGVVISVIGDQKLYLLINKDNYKNDSAWVEIGKTISLTWSNITEKPEFLETIEGDVDTIKSDLENLETIVEDNQISLLDRIETIENESLPEIENTLSGLDELLSDHYYIWHGDDDLAPELTTEPAVQWGSDSLKRSHLGDFYINTLGYCYKFVLENGKFMWKQVEDRYIVPYARHIEKKSTIFLNQPSTESLCKPGDLWIGATYYEDGVSTPLYKDTVLVCIEEKLEGDEFDISQWEVSPIASTADLGELSKTVENYRTRVIIDNKSQLYKEETWIEPETGQLWIYNGLVISVINEEKLYLLVNKERYMYDDAWIEIGKTLSLTWGNITEKPEFLDTIDGRVDELETQIQNFDTNLNDNVTEITERLNVIENEEIPEINMSIEGINELLSDHYYIWQGDDESIPDLTNDPAIQWSTDALKRSHLGDFFINTLGYCYKFIQQGNTYKWVEVKDRYIVPYAKRIAGKSTIFISQPETEDLYSPGDIWLNATYKDDLGNLLYDRKTLVCIEGKIEGEDFSIDQWEEASIVDKELEEVDQKIENYRTRIILNKKSQLLEESTWLTAEGDLWIYNGLVVSVIDEQKLYLLIDKDNYKNEESWIEIGKTLSLTWDNITDKPDLSAADHNHQVYEDSLVNLDNNVSTLQEEMKEVKEALEGYDNNLFPKIEENLEEINDSLIGQFYIWHGSDNEIPNSFNYPEVDWATREDKKSHIGDFFITLDGQCFKYTEIPTGFEWKPVNDRYITSYAERLNHKATIFNEVPKIDEAYQPGDIWINAVYTDEFGTRVFNNDIALCITGKEVGDEFNWADWQGVLKAEEVNIDNTTVTVGANQFIKGHKTFGVPVYFGEEGTGPGRDGEEAYQPLYSSLYDDGNNNFTLEAGKRASTSEVKNLNIKNITAGGIRITTELNDDFKGESVKSGDINISSTKGGNIGIYSNNDAGVVAGSIYIQTKSAKKENEKDDSIGIVLDPKTNTASIYSQETKVTGLCDGYAEVSGFKGLAITSKATASKSDMTGARFKWEKTDADGNEINTLDIHRVSYEEGEVIQNSLSIKINGSAEVLTSANFKTYVDAEGNIIDFNTGYINNPDEMTGAIDVSEKLQTAINDAIANNAKLVIKYGTYLLSKPVVIKSLDESFEYFTIEANNSLFLCDKGIIANKANYGGTLPFGGTQDDDLKVDEVKSTGSLFVIGSNPSTANESKMDLGTVDIRNMRIKAANSKRSEWIAFDIQAQKCVHFDKVVIENFHTGFRINRCTNNPTIKRSSIINSVFGINAVGNVRNLTIEDCILSKNGTGVYINKSSLGDFACNTITHSTFEDCYYGIYGHSAYASKAFRIKCNKFNSNESMDILMKNTIIYPTIENVTFSDISQTVTKTDESGNEYQEEVVIPWESRANIPISLPDGYIINSSNAIPSELSEVSPGESSIGGFHTASWTKTPPVWGDSNISITDNIFYDCKGVQIGNGEKGGHISGVQFSNNRIESSVEKCIKICSELNGNCSAVSVFNNTYQSTKRDASTGNIIPLDFEVPAKSSLLEGSDYMPVGGVMARYQTKPSVPELSTVEDGQVGDLRWDETKAYLKTEKGWKAIQFTHTFDNKSSAKAWKPLETSGQQPATIDGYNVGDIVWNLDGSSRTLGWRLVKDSQNLVSWQRIEDLIRAYFGG